MREIKFRAWDKHSKVMCDVRMLTWSMHDLFTQNDGRYHVMQFTGLHDKNGKEIYEGDILRGKEAETDTTTGELRMTVNDAFSDYAALRDAVIDKKDIEIIGNIYQNPELLDEKKEV